MTRTRPNAGASGSYGVSRYFRLIAAVSFLLCGAHRAAAQGDPKADPVRTAGTAPQEGRYLFGTLETANGRIFTELGLSCADVARRERAAGMGIAQITLAWKDYEPSDGVFNENQMTYVASNIKTFLKAGLKVDLQLAVHYVPAWVMQIPHADYRNQWGVAAPSAYDSADPNYVFNATVREKVGAFQTHALRALQAEVGLEHIFEIRVDAGAGGEAYYPQTADDRGHRNSYWAYDANAQGRENNRPAGVRAAPFPEWRPGQTTWQGQSFGLGQVQQWYDWYFDSRMNYYNWQIDFFRKAGYRGYLLLETPGFGTRPDEYRHNLRHHLDGANDPNGTMCRAAVWQLLYPAVSNKKNMVAYVSSMADGSGDPPNDLAQPSDAGVHFADDPQVNKWGAVRYVGYLAQQYGFAIMGENPGYGPGGAGRDYGPAMLANQARQMQAGGLMGMFWAHDERLYTTKHTPAANVITLDDYAKVIRQYNKAAR